MHKYGTNQTRRSKNYKENISEWGPLDTAEISTTYQEMQDINARVLLGIHIPLTKT